MSYLSALCWRTFTECLGRAMILRGRRVLLTCEVSITFCCATFFSGKFCVIIVDLWRWLGTVTNSCCIWELRAILSPADASISACLCAFHRWLESPLTHTLESTESERAGLKNSLVVVCCCWIFFFLSGLFPPCVALFPVCSVSCLSNDHFEAVSLSCVILQTHRVYVQIVPHTAWVKWDRGEGHEAVRKVNQMRDELPAQTEVCATRILDTAFPHWKEL